ncbi:hypothetical protein CcCBS67573_g03941 [Chytriomyces confervae]|uniref:F-box domain-containing protein n=1 Tax=Chytriomyces confervae TaxID=246404 RepID=A0A507FEL5_9FUNG|nr:hypothetical protein CcCBS67573_g03941 [Chytriomyces confervae]
MHLHELPVEVLVQIFWQLGPFNVAKYRRVCRCINNVLSARPFSNLIGLVHIGQAARRRRIEVFSFVTPASFGADFLAKVQERALYSFAGQFSKFPVNTLNVCPINPLTATSETSLFESFPSLSSKSFCLACPLPSGIRSLTRLTSLDFGGKVVLMKRGVGNMATLTNVDMMTNTVAGPFLTELANLINLKKLSLSDIEIHEAIPDNFGNLVNLEVLNISNAKLSGSIPASFANLVNMVELRLQMNELSGTVPDVFTGMAKLQILLLSGNYLEGPIPQSIGRCMQLIELGCDLNRFSGPIPESIFRLPLLRNLTLQQNLLILDSSPRDNASVQFIGMEDTPPTSIIHPDLHHESGTATFPPASLDLQSLNVSSNQLKMDTHAEDGVSQVFSYLILSRNQLSGRLPNYITALKTLRYLCLDDNNLDGPFPTEIGGFLNLRCLCLRRNQFSGGIPNSISNVVSLEELNLSRNLFVGSIPDSITALVNLTRLKLQHNELDGWLPAEIGLLASLKVLNISHNRFVGEIPESIGNLHVLQLLDVSHNLFVALWSIAASHWSFDKLAQFGPQPQSIDWFHTGEHSADARIKYTKVGSQSTVGSPTNKQSSAQADNAFEPQPQSVVRPHYKAHNAVRIYRERESQQQLFHWDFAPHVVSKHATTNQDARFKQQQT